MEGAGGLPAVPPWGHLPDPNPAANPLQKQMDEGEFRRLMNDLDHDKDSEVDFKEYACFLACVAMGYNEFFRDAQRPRKK